MLESIDSRLVILTMNVLWWGRKDVEEIVILTYLSEVCGRTHDTTAANHGRNHCEGTQLIIDYRL
jgi:hypothetical protein